MYVPKVCEEGQKCAVHISFHGCSQNFDQIGLEFVKNSGLNEIAEANNLIILYP